MGGKTKVKLDYSIINNDAVAWGTKIIDLHTGKELHGVRKVTWIADASKDKAIAIVELHNVSVDVKVNSEGMEICHG